MSTKRIIKLGLYTALFSFLLGSVVFGLYFLNSSSDLLLIGYYFIVLTGLLNTGILIVVLVKAFQDKENRKKLFITFSIQLLNIPVVILYFWLVGILLETMRITFINTTKVTLKNVEIVGCGGGIINEIEPGESEIVWVDITRDCSIRIYYNLNGQQKSENVVFYVTKNDGKKIKHKIGGFNKPFF